MRQFLITLFILILCAFTEGYAQNTPQNIPRNPRGDRVGEYRTDEFGNKVDRFGNQIDPSTLPKDLNDSSDVEIQSLAPKLFMWKIEERLGIPYRIQADTLFHHFQNENLSEGLTGHYNHLGNLGSPRMSRIFYQREMRDIPYFMQNYSQFYFTPSDHKFTNSNIPYTNITYFRGGSRIDGEDHLKAYFSVNVNKRFAIGFNFDYLYGRGYYRSQSTSFFNGGLFASYDGDKYQSHFMYNNFSFKMAENAGITDDRYITHPEEMADGKQKYETQNIPTVLDDTWNRNTNFYVYYNHKYNLGFTRVIKPEPIEIVNDSIDPDNESEFDVLPDSIAEPQTEFVPVTSFIHTLKVERNRHKFLSRNEPKDLYDNTYIRLNENMSDDRTTYMGIHNTFGIALAEDLNKWVKPGLTAFITHKANRYTLLTKDTARTTRYEEYQLFVGGELARRKGKRLNYRVLAEFGLSKQYTGDFKVDGDIDFNFRIRKDTMHLRAYATIENSRPSFYKRHFHANHFYWDEGKNGMPKFSREFRQRIGGEIAFPKWRTKINVGVEFLKDYTYFGPKATPLQYGDNINVMHASLSQNFKLGIFHLDNEITWQKSSKNEIIPLPSLSLYHNLYIQAKLAKNILTLQFGADVRYFTKYRGLAYSPGIQNFHLQPEKEQVDIGGYPLINLYLNIHLKKTRIFAMMYHVNEGMGNSNYFFTPHHPINPRLFKFGISWNFYD